MRLDNRLIILFAFPFIAALSCTAVWYLLPEEKPYRPERPQFLDYIDRLGVAGENPNKGEEVENVRNVFSQAGPDEEEGPDPEDEPAPEEQAPCHDPVSVSMVVDRGPESFCVVNGKRMRSGESSGTFTLTAVRSDAVTIRYLDGSEETIHVKAY